MYLKISCLILIFYFSMGKSTEIQCGIMESTSPIQSYIVGGHHADYMQFPWLVSIHKGGKHICGAVLINSKFVLTAAHCLVNDRGRKFPVHRLKVVLGINNWNKTEPYRQDISVKKTFVHENFDYYEKKDDLGLIELSQQIDFQRTKIRPICLPSINDLYKDSAYLAGWGKTSVTAPCPSHDLLYIALPLTDSKTCIEELKSFRYNEHLYSTTICSLHRRSGVDGCDGDSGGPMMCIDKTNNKIYVCGIMSFGCLFCSGFSVYTKISLYRDWIHNTMQNPGNDHYIPKKEKDDDDRHH